MTVDLKQLSAPDAVMQVSYETVLAEMLADLQARDSSLNLSPSDPAYKILEVTAYRETLIRQEANDRAKGLLLAHAAGSDLDHIGVTYYRTQRLLIDAGNPTAVPPIAPTYESDDEYRDRLLIAEDGYSTAGPAAAYRYHAMSASGDVKDVSVLSPTFSRLTLTQAQIDALPVGAQAYVPVDDLGLADPTPASVVITVLSRIGDGTPDAALLTTVDTALGADVRPITDEVIVQAATIINYTINATLTLYAGFNQEYIRSTAEASLLDYIARHHELGHAPTELGVRSSLKVEGVHDAVLNDTLNGTDMTASLTVPDTHAAYCLGVIVAVGGVV